MFRSSAGRASRADDGIGGKVDVDGNEEGNDGDGEHDDGGDVDDVDDKGKAIERV